MLAIQISNAWKYYQVNGKKEAVLRGLDMTVPCGALYCLIGSSGCGKTSLLSCIVGIRKLNSGTVLLFGNRPGTNDVGIPGKNVGYMPQDISLYGEFSISETFRYFGTLSGMSDEEVDERSRFLRKLLELPNLSRRINTLSGGTQRRVSFAASLISNPKLLILDEPTVGVDAVLRQKIWTYLRKLASSEGTTIIISTHYLDEARQADLIGIIRDGRMLTETSPTQLINSSNAAGVLEAAVLKLCKKQSSAVYRENNMVPTAFKAVDRVSKSFVSKQHFKESLARIRAIVRKNFSILFRNILFLSFVIWIPAVEVLSACVSFGYSPAHLRIGVINQEVNVTFCPQLSPVPGECDQTLLSCHFLRHISKQTIDLVPFDLEHDAEAAIHSGSIWGYLRLPSNFSSSIYERAVSGVNVDEITLNSSQILVKLDETNKQISIAIKIALHDALSDFTSTLLTNCGFDSRQGLSPFQYGNPVFGKPGRDVSEYISPSAAVALVFFWPIVTVGVRFIEERENGILERSIVSGARTWEIMVAFLISEFFILIPQTALALAVATLVSEIKIVGSIYLAFGLLLLVGCCGASLGIFFGTVCREKIEIPILALASFMPSLVLSGICWPVEGMPEYLQNAVNILPCTLPAESIRSIISRGWDLSHDNVWPGFVVLVIHTILYFVLGLLYKFLRTN